MLWKNHLTNKRCLIFVDNEGTKFALLKGSSENPTVDLLAGYFAEVETSIHTFAWLARVPSKSNIADPHSRNDLSSKYFSTAKNVSNVAALILTELVSRIAKNGEMGFETNQIVKKRVKRSWDLWTGFLSKKNIFTLANFLGIPGLISLDLAFPSIVSHNVVCSNLSLFCSVNSHWLIGLILRSWRASIWCINVEHQQTSGWTCGRYEP